MEDLKTTEQANETSQPQSENYDTDASLETNESVSVNEAEQIRDQEVDYGALIISDIKALRSEFPELSELSDICELENPLRYASLRDLGLSPAEAYLATARRHKKDNRSHLNSTRTVASAPQSSMTEAEMATAREIFGDISDSEIRKLYKRVTK